MNGCPSFCLSHTPQISSRLDFPQRFLEISRESDTGTKRELLAGSPFHTQFLSTARPFFDFEIYYFIFFAFSLSFCCMVSAQLHFLDTKEKGRLDLAASVSLFRAPQLQTAVIRCQGPVDEDQRGLNSVPWQRCLGSDDVVGLAMSVYSGCSIWYGAVQTGRLPT